MIIIIIILGPGEIFKAVPEPQCWVGAAEREDLHRVKPRSRSHHHQIPVFTVGSKVPGYPNPLTSVLSK